MSGICYIMGASKDSQMIFHPDTDDYVIAADAGYKFLKDKNIKIDLVVGDFDSLGYVPDEKNMVVLPKIKDISDLNRCFLKAVELGYQKIRIYGCMGGRIDQSIATLQDACGYSRKNMDIEIYSGNNILKILRNGTFEVEREKGFISVFALEKSDGVTIKNLKYEVENITLDTSFPLGLSNEFINKKAAISVADGCLVIVY